MTTDILVDELRQLLVEDNPGILWNYRYGDDDEKTQFGLLCDRIRLLVDRSVEIRFTSPLVLHGRDKYVVIAKRDGEWRQRLYADDVHNRDWDPKLAPLIVMDSDDDPLAFAGPGRNLPYILDKMGHAQLKQQMWAARRDKALVDKAVAIHNAQQLVDLAEGKFREATTELSKLMETARDVTRDKTLSFRFPEDGVAEVDDKKPET